MDLRIFTEPQQGAPYADHWAFVAPRQVALPVVKLTNWPRNPLDHFVLADIEAGRFLIEPGVEDVHSQVEFNLTKSIGEAGKKIHSGRSRNDQVAVDLKLFLRAEILPLPQSKKIAESS